MKKDEFSAASIDVLRWLDYVSDESAPEDEGEEEGIKVEKEVKEGTYTLSAISFFMSNIIFIPDKEAEQKSKGKEAAVSTRKKSSSKGKKASKKGEKGGTDNDSCRSFILIVFINTDVF
jgi:hypothetical protein